MADSTQQRYLAVKPDERGNLTESNVEAVVQEIFNMVNLVEQRVAVLESAYTALAARVTDLETP